MKYMLTFSTPDDFLRHTTLTLTQARGVSACILTNEDGAARSLAQTLDNVFRTLVVLNVDCRRMSEARGDYGFVVVPTDTAAPYCARLAALLVEKSMQVQFVPDIQNRLEELRSCAAKFYRQMHIRTVKTPHGTTVLQCTHTQHQNPWVYKPPILVDTTRYH